MVIRQGVGVDFEQLMQLRESAGWQAISATILARQAEGSHFVFSAVVGDELVGFVRAISDGVSNGYLLGLVVAANYRRIGIGSELVRHVIEHHPSIRWVLRASGAAAAFYERLGFQPAGDMFCRERAG